jgi:4-hydroxy-tetrahydrodipicolinate synthase
VARLAHISNIIGIKEATGNMARLQQILKDSGERIDVYSGDDLTAGPWLLEGAKGVISVTANVAPKAMAKMCDAAMDGDRAECMQWHKRLLPLHQLMFVEANPIPVKWAACRLGLIGDEIRSPLTPLSAAHHAPLEQALHALNLGIYTQDISKC